MVLVTNASVAKADWAEPHWCCQGWVREQGTRDAPAKGTLCRAVQQQSVSLPAPEAGGLRQLLHRTLHALCKLR